MTFSMLLLALTAAAPVRVDSLATLQARIDSAHPGDVIVLKDGEYTATAPIAVHARGRAGAPIRVAAETAGGVTLHGTDGFDVAADAAFVEIDGFAFMHRSGRTQIHGGASHIRFTEMAPT
jgi:poly(beta-D-mannuronate) lyase